MKNTTVAGLLRAALALWTAAVLTAATCFVPGFMRHICTVRPEWTGWYGWGVAFGWLLAAMMLWAFMLLWRVMGTVAQGRAFVRKNATRFRRVWQLSVASFTLCAGLGIFMVLTNILPPFLVLTVTGLLLATATAGLASFALSGLCQSAALLREESEMTAATSETINRALQTFFCLIEINASNKTTQAVFPHIISSTASSLRWQRKR